MRFIVLYILMPLIMLFPAVTYGQTRTLNILYTGGVNGELEPCGCSPKTDFGGVARRSGYIAEHQKMLSPYILIDAGNFLDKDTPQGRLKAKAMLKAFGIMKYDVVAILKNEKEFPYNFLSALLKKYKISVISDMPRYRQAISTKRDAFDVNVSVNPMNYHKGKLNILLTDNPISEIKSLKGWDIIILSSGEILEEPLKANGTIIVSGYPKGERLGILTLQIDGSGEVLEFKHRWQSLGKDIKEDINVRKALKEYDVRVAGLLKDNSKPLAEISYLGASKCGECHQPFVESWKKTRHAAAFSSLERTGKSADPECIKCHTAGFGEKGGFYSTKTTPMLTNIQCEACHGPGRDHLLDFSKPMQPVAEYVCLKCHTKSTSPDFNYPVYLEKIKHK
ncbi:MAG: multiheme c-type cytochrome [Thermodesulfovibrionales bacterium]|nr:multiheme c-type cytochrome [Thermodesulfovibrionales bacterium]